MTAPTAAAITTSCDAELDAVRNVFSRGQVDGKAQGENRSLALESLEILRHGQMMLRGRTHAARDRMMAANVAWIANTVFPNARIAVSAHDGHICTYDSHWMTLGSELRRIFGSAYYALGTTFGTGAVRAHPVAGGPFIPVQISKVPETSVATLFGNITEPFFLDIDAVPAASPLGQWLNQPQSLWMPGGVVLPQNVKPYALDRLTLARAFDGIVYLPVSHPTAAL
jgi:erythromycin esterase-like protein